MLLSRSSKFYYTFVHLFVEADALKIDEMDQSQTSGKEHIIEIPENDSNLEDSSSYYDSSDPMEDSGSEDYEMEPWKYNDNLSDEYESSIEDNQSEASEKVSIDIGHLFSIKPTRYIFKL